MSIGTRSLIISKARGGADLPLWPNGATIPNAVPYVSEGVGLVYTVGARHRKWTIEALDWKTGEPAFHYVLGGARYNSLFAGVTMDEDGRIVIGTSFGKIRVERRPVVQPIA